jgi:hypothetical protein
MCFSLTFFWFQSWHLLSKERRRWQVTLECKLTAKPGGRFFLDMSQISWIEFWVQEGNWLFCHLGVKKLSFWFISAWRHGRSAKRKKSKKNPLFVNCLLSLLRKESSSLNSKNCHFMKFVVEVNKLVIMIYFNLSTFHKASHHPNCH